MSTQLLSQNSSCQTAGNSSAGPNSSRKIVVRIDGRKVRRMLSKLNFAQKILKPLVDEILTAVTGMSDYEFKHRLRNRELICVVSNTQYIRACQAAEILSEINNDIVKCNQKRYHNFDLQKVIVNNSIHQVLNSADLDATDTIYINGETMKQLLELHELVGVTIQKLDDARPVKSNNSRPIIGQDKKADVPKPTVDVQTNNNLTVSEETIAKILPNIIPMNELLGTPKNEGIQCSLPVDGNKLNAQQNYNEKNEQKICSEGHKIDVVSLNKQRHGDIEVSNESLKHIKSTEVSSGNPPEHTMRPSQSSRFVRVESSKSWNMVAEEDDRKSDILKQTHDPNHLDERSLRLNIRRRLLTEQSNLPVKFDKGDLINEPANNDNELKSVSQESIHSAIKVLSNIHQSCVEEKDCAECVSECKKNVTFSKRESCINTPDMKHDVPMLMLPKVFKSVPEAKEAMLQCVEEMNLISNYLSSSDVALESDKRFMVKILDHDKACEGDNNPHMHMEFCSVKMKLGSDKDYKFKSDLNTASMNAAKSDVSTNTDLLEHDLGADKGLSRPSNYDASNKTSHTCMSHSHGETSNCESWREISISTKHSQSTIPEDEPSRMEPSPTQSYPALPCSDPRFNDQICESMVTDVDSLRRLLGNSKDVHHPNPSVDRELLQIGLDGVLRACTPAKCAVCTTINDRRLDDDTPHKPSLKSLPLSRSDVAVIRRNAEASQLSRH